MSSELGIPSGVLPLHLGRVAADVAQQLIANMNAEVPLVRTPGGPAFGWLTGLELRDGHLWGSASFVEAPGGLGDVLMFIDLNAVNRTTGARIGASLYEVLATPLPAKPDLRQPFAGPPGPLMSSLGVRPSANVQPRQERSIMATDVIRMGIAKDRAAREGISLHTALRQITAECDARARAGSPSPAPTGPITVPPMPSGEVTLASARAHLETNMPGFRSLGPDLQFEAAKNLRTLCKSPQVAQLSRRTNVQGGAVLLFLWPGKSQLTRARNFLASTVQGWDGLPLDDQWAKAKQLLATRAIVDVGEVLQ